MSGRILAIVVSYNPKCAPLLRALESLESQACDVLIIDNGSSQLHELRGSLATLSRTRLIEQGRNLGLGAAHNIGFQYAEKNGYEYCLILDQDSIPLEGMADALYQAHQRKSQHHKVSAVGVTYLNADNGSESFFVRFGKLKFSRHYCGSKDEDGCVEADFLISSGSLVSLDAFSTIGPMDETLFIDHVDTEWFLRARSSGFQAFGVCEAVMQHGLGENTHRVSIGGRRRNVPQHKPFRYYYIFRNSILLYKRSYASNLWKWNDVQRLGMIAIMFGLLTQPRLSNMKMMLLGSWHGLRGKTGQLGEPSNNA